MNEKRIRKVLAVRVFSFIVCGCLVLIANCALAVALDESTNFHDSSVQIKARCHESDSGVNCGIYASGAAGERKVIDYPGAPTSILMTSGVFVIEFPCGTQCSATYFYSERSGLGGPFPFVEAYDVERGVVLLSKRNPLPMYAMFSKQSLVVGEVALDISKGSDAFVAIKEAVVQDHRFVITYTDHVGNVRTIRRQVPILKGRLTR
ncbi:TPA: hypothetical protein QDC27_007256 [Burkholderia cepacia ATCC 25416]|uniref:hypothetical protein n=1 Tax=Burkholderia cepacia TaxID=292 RepID=UPI000F5E2F68|nr:hypothetical protein [Burkholderia cepacia]HDR9771617.1 hypothetical protein [Burkholderia cepacia ATCC 25416]MCA8029263.1 hypothetical protein [Burkholderia cepacia]MCA8078203.1 hypothetical protein [Burkholderia cepacia]HDR9779390.1 hypothetical protein [Burkholderia cepacia ATCC 25416]HDR9787401.1 hypothetical protein [Burkholderia cepacia ATCC 25416]